MNRDRARSALLKRSVVVAGHRTSVSLEEPFWKALKSIAASRGKSLNALIAEIDAARDSNLSSALRLHVLRALESAAARRSAA